MQMIDRTKVLLLPPSGQTRKYLDIAAKHLLEGKAAQLKNLELLKLMSLPPAPCQKTGIWVAGQSYHFYTDCEGMRILVVSAPVDNATPIQAFVCDVKHSDTRFY
jgi:hypothetical protein